MSKYVQIKSGKPDKQFNIEENLNKIASYRTNRDPIFIGDNVFVPEEKDKSRRVKYALKDDLGFAWNVYQQSSDRFCDIKDSHIARLMYLITMTNYSGKIRGITGETDVDDTKELASILRISRGEASQFKHIMSDAGYLYRNESGLYVDQSVSRRGRLNAKTMSKYLGNGMAVTRMYFSAVRDLYLRSPKILAILIHLLPYIHPRFNYLCTNPFNDGLDAADCISLREACQLIGYTDRRSRQLQSVLFDATVPTKNIRVPVFSERLLLGMEQPHIFVNPNIFYASEITDLNNVLSVIGEQPRCNDAAAQN